MVRPVSSIKPCCSATSPNVTQVPTPPQAPTNHIPTRVEVAMLNQKSNRWDEPAEKLSYRLSLEESANDAKLLAYTDKRCQSLLYMFLCMCCRELHADAGLSHRHDGVAESNHVDALLKKLIGH